MSNLLDTALILARRGETDELVELLQTARRWRDTGNDVTEEAIVEALGYQPAQEGDASGGGGSVVYEVSQRWPALMRSTAVPFSDIFHNAFTIEELLIDAGTPPASTYDFEVLTGGTVIETVTLSSPPELFTIASSLSAKERLEVLPNSGTASDLANVTFSFLLSI